MVKHNQCLQIFYYEKSHVHISFTKQIQTTHQKCYTLLPIFYPKYISYIHLQLYTCMTQKLCGLHYKVFCNFFNFFDGRVIQFYNPKEVIFIIVSPLHLQRHTTFTYYNFMQYINLLQLLFFSVQSSFHPLQYHDLSFA